jgi:hypothetical protein
MVWAWLGQIGQGRGGFYSYDWLENLFGADIHNADRLHPQLTPPVPGDTIRLTYDRYLGGGFTRLSALPVASVETGRSFVLRGWGTFVVESLDAYRSRVIVRERIPQATSAWSALSRKLLFDPGHFVMERQMLRGIRDRAEERPYSDLLAAIAVAGFVAAAGGIVWVLARRSRWGRLLLPIGVAVLPLTTTSDVRATLAAFVAVGLPLVAFSELRAPAWLALPRLFVAAWTLLFVAPDAFLIIGWLLGAFTLAAVLVLSWLAIEPAEAEDVALQPRSLVSHL